MRNQDLKLTFMSATEIHNQARVWDGNPAGALKKFKDVAKSMAHIARHDEIQRYRQFAAPGSFTAARDALNEAANKIMPEMRNPKIIFGNQFEVKWKLALMLSHLGRKQEALEFIEAAEQLIKPDHEKYASVLDKKTHTLFGLHQANPHAGYGSRALEAARILVKRSPEHLPLLHQIERSVASAPQPRPAFA